MAHVRLEALRLGVEVACRGLIVLRLREFQQLRGIRDALGGALDLADIAGQTRALASELLGAGGVGPDGGVFELAPYFLEPLVLAVVLKETPVARRCVPRDL